MFTIYDFLFAFLNIFSSSLFFLPFFFFSFLLSFFCGVIIHVRLFQWQSRRFIPQRYCSMFPWLSWVVACSFFAAQLLLPLTSLTSSYTLPPTSCFRLQYKWHHIASTTTTLIPTVATHPYSPMSHAQNLSSGCILCDFLSFPFFLNQGRK